ncbi:universal stress protein [Nitrosomonas marina]|uniref:Nucleotide-binding universal stress protein, UspA family n=1 Tax=Nitrosomonas marina TaxID=917 RepID=A0A1H8E6A4_9PROT|nr:universal stress protein [Nitrosomonas marina]SEN14644.1 Nucleotide-binding universal stress protein, UspA family [Nitrosomonas marina]
MLKILLPIDGSDNSSKAVKKMVEMMNWYKAVPEIHLLNVQFPLDGNVSLFISQDDIKQYHQEEGTKCLQKAVQLLDQEQIKYSYHITIGDPAMMIEQFAANLNCDLVIISARGHGAIKNLLLGSVVSKVIQLSSTPVLLVK